MEEIKFLAAQNLKNQILYLENCIEDMKRFGAKICVSWEESVQKLNSCSIVTQTTITQVKALPKDIEDKTIQLMKNKLEELKQQFIEL